MRAAYRIKYGNSEVLQVGEVPRPQIKAGEMLIAVRASSINPADRYIMMGLPKLLRLAEGITHPRRSILGRDYAGEVVQVGDGVNDFAVGDLVFGEATQTWADFVVVKPNQARIKPTNLSFEHAGCVPLAGLTAYQALSKANLVAGDHVLIIGASGGVGTFAVQIAKAAGASVTAVCSGRNVELVDSLGADRTIDYLTHDFARDRFRYRVIFDAVGEISVGEIGRLLEPGGVYLSVGAAMDFDSRGGRNFGPISRYSRLMIASKPGASGRRMVLVAAKPNVGLGELSQLIERGSVRVVVDRGFELDDVASAIEYIGTHRARGKLALAVSAPT